MATSNGHRFSGLVASLQAPVTRLAMDCWLQRGQPRRDTTTRPAPCVARGATNRKHGTRFGLCALRLYPLGVVFTSRVCTPVERGGRTATALHALGHGSARFEPRAHLVGLRDLWDSEARGTHESGSGTTGRLGSTSAGAREDDSTGRRSAKVLPAPSSLSTSMVPWWRSTISLVM